MLTLSSLTRTAKKYAIDSSVSNEEFLNAFIQPYIEAGRIKARNGEVFHLNAPRTSNLVNGKADIPQALKKSLSRFGIADATAKRMNAFVSDYIGSDDAPYLMADTLSLLDLGEEADRRAYEKLAKLRDDAPSFLTAALIEALGRSNIAPSRQALWQSGTGSLSVEVGDLLSKGFGRRRKYRNIVVVPVDSAFDTVVTAGCETFDKPRVSAMTLHGKWLQRMYQCGETTKSLDKRIHENLELRGIRPLDSEIQGRRYPIGTVAVVENDKAFFFLLAVSDFDEGNVARSTSDTVRDALDVLIDTYDAMGQGFDLYLPLIGTGLSRAGLCHIDSYRLIAETLGRRAQNIHGNITIIVRPDDVIRLKPENKPR